MPPIPAAILRALSSTLGTSPIDPSKATLSSSSSGFTTTGCLTVRVPCSTEDGEAGKDVEDKKPEGEYKVFVKTSSNGIAAREMFRGEYESLNAIADALQSDNEVAGSFCPRGIAWGCLSDESSWSISGSGSSEPSGGGGQRDESEGETHQKDWFLITEFVDLRGGGGRGGSSSSSLAQRLGRLHSIPAPPPNTGGRTATSTKANKRMFGFPVPTFCGDTKQPNRFRDSWADFYAEERLLTVLETSETRNGKDSALRQLVEKTARTVVPRLLGDGHLGYDDEGRGEGIVPVVVHGDLWSGNAGWGCIFRNGRRNKLTGNDDDGEEEEEGGGGGGGGGDFGAVVYDPSACYAHSEYELGMMKMFGGFGRDFFNEYHRIVPKTEPVGEYEDRLKLYELYHHLNHHAIFGSGYRSGAVSIMQSLVRKYGQQ